MILKGAGKLRLYENVMVGTMILQITKRLRQLYLWRSIQQIALLLCIQIFSRRCVMALVRAGGLGDTICILSSLGPMKDRDPDLWVVLLTPAFCSLLIDTFSMVDQSADLGSLFHFYCKVTCRRSRYKKMYLPVEQGHYTANRSFNPASHFASALGVKPSTARGEFVLPQWALKRADELLARHLGENLALVLCHSGPTWPVREYPLQSWNELVRAVKERFPVSVVQIGFDKSLSVDASQRPYLIDGTINLVNQLSLVELAALMKRANLFIGIDSGPLHIAVCQGLQSIAIFGSTLPEAVLSNLSKITAVIADEPCIGCHHHETGPVHWKSGCPHSIRCMTTLSPEEVFEQVTKSGLPLLRTAGNRVDSNEDGVIDERDL